MTAPSNANTSGLEVVAWRFRDHPGNGWIYTGLGDRHEGCEVEPLVTAASAQARIDHLLARIETARVARVEHNRQFEAMKDRATAAEARADRQAEIAGKLDAAISWLDYPFIDNRTPEAELRQRVGFMMKDAEPHRAALQQETQP